MWNLATQQDDAGEDISQASVALHFRILHVAAHFNVGFSMPCAWEGRGYAECFSLPIEIGDAPVDLMHQALRTAHSMPILECMRQAARILADYGGIRSQTRRRMNSADMQFATAIGQLNAAHFGGMHDSPFEATFTRAGIKRRLSETLGPDPDLGQLPPLSEFLTSEDMDGRVDSWLKPGFEALTISLATGIRIALKQVQTKAAMAIQLGGATNFRKAVVREHHHDRSDGHKVTRLVLLGLKQPGSPSCKSCAIWVARETEVLQRQKDMGNIWLTGTKHFCLSTTNVFESQISVIPPVNAVEGADAERWCTVQLVDLHEYAFIYQALSKIFKDVRELRITSLQAHTAHPAMRTWLGLPNQVGRRPESFTRSGSLENLLGRDRSELIVLCLISIEHIILV